jgi:hypothetical protein
MQCVVDTLFFHLVAGLLLIKIKALWRVALLLSTVIRYPISECSDVLECKALAEKRALLYTSIEKSVLQLGLFNLLFHFYVFCWVCSLLHRSVFSIYLFYHHE